MTRSAKRQAVLERLRELEHEFDVEAMHAEADRLILNLINDPEIVAAWEAVPKWFA